MSLVRTEMDKATPWEEPNELREQIMHSETP